MKPLRARVVTRMPIRKEWIDEVKALLPGITIDVFQTDKQMKVYFNNAWGSMYGDFKSVREITNATGYDIRALFMPYRELQALGVTNHLALYDNNDRDGVLDFYVGLNDALDDRARANGFKSNFAWEFVHEALHGMEQGLGREYMAPNGDRVHAYEAQGRLKELLQGNAVTIPLIKTTLDLLKKLLPFAAKSKSETLYQFALKYLGTDASPADLADDVVGCAETVTTILKAYMGFPVILGTATLYSNLETNPKFKRVTVPMPGNIVLSPTGMGNGNIQGHVGFVGQNGQILSNDSYTGKFSANFTLDTWNARYRDKGGLPVLFYSII